MSDAAQRVAIVTGGAGGIGLETVRGLAAAGMRVIAGCRDVKKGGAAVHGMGAAVEAWTLDLARLSSVRSFAERALAELPRIDVVVCNGGVWPGGRRKTADGFELAFGVNHLAHFALVEQLRERLVATGRDGGARIVVVSSGLHARGTMHWDDLQLERRYDGTDAYAQSKLANVLWTLWLARSFGAPRAGTGVTANACHPGVVATQLLRHQPPGTWDRGQRLTPTDGARPSLHLALAPALAGITGRYFHRLDEKKPAPAALDRAAQDRLATISTALCRLPPAPPDPARDG
ncbi:MAG TPA: SDR family NAD(P)-dependent oxidoreductase [Kofleriaceae bacterium]|nr:SDR family NAD(P)-dependent oxidoreductase [Kofleriaceae bacterium]